MRDSYTDIYLLYPFWITIKKQKMKKTHLAYVTRGKSIVYETDGEILGIGLEFSKNREIENKIEFPPT